VEVQVHTGDNRVPTLGVVGLFDSNPAAIVRISRLLESAGFEVISRLIPDARSRRLDVEAFMKRHDPAVVIYEIGPPYKENWAMFEQIRATSMRDCRFVLTSANAAQVERLAEHDERIFEIVDNRFDVDNVVQAVKEAIRTRRLIRAAADPQPTHPRVTVTEERRVIADRRQSSWTSNEVYQKLRAKREEMESERRRIGRRTTDRDHSPSSHAA